MVFIFHFVNMVYHIDWFTYMKESLHPWNKPNLIMVYELFDVLLKFFFFFLNETTQTAFSPSNSPRRERRTIINGRWQLHQAAPNANFTLRRKRCVSSSWFRVLYTIRETSLVTNYRNDPWKYINWLILQWNLSQPGCNCFSALPTTRWDAWSDGRLQQELWKGVFELLYCSLPYNMISEETWVFPFPSPVKQDQMSKCELKRKHVQLSLPYLTLAWK